MEFPFKDGDGISPVFDRYEATLIVNILLHNNLLYSPYINIEDDINELQWHGIMFYANLKPASFCPNYTEDEFNEIPYEEFKQRLLDYEKILTDKK